MVTKGEVLEELYCQCLWVIRGNRWPL